MYTLGATYRIMIFMGVPLMEVLLYIVISERATYAEIAVQPTGVIGKIAALAEIAAQTRLFL